MPRVLFIATLVLFMLPASTTGAPSASALNAENVHATASAPAPHRLDYVAIGDSVTGTGSAAPNGWVNGYAASIGATKITNLAQNGWTSGQMLDALRYNPAYREALQESDLVTVNAGMNEFFTTRDLYSKGACGGLDNEDCVRTMVPRFASNWNAILAEIRSLAPHANIIALNLYHPLEVFDAHFGWAEAMNRAMRQMNSHIHASGLLTADIFTAYNGPSGLDDPISKGYILPDAIHATDLGHAVIVAVLKKLDYAGLPQTN